MHTPVKANLLPPRAAILGQTHGLRKIKMTTVNHNLNYPLLRIYSNYRLVLGAVLLLMFISDLAPNVLGTLEPKLFLYTSSIFTAASFATLLILWRRTFSPTPEQIFFILFVDIIALTLLIHASGGIGSGLGFMLLITIAAGGIFLNRQVGSALAAVAFLMVLAETIYLTNHNIANSRYIFSAGILGAMLFACTLTFNYLSDKLISSAQEAAHQAAHVAHLQHLARLIIERMQTGIIVASPAGKIELMNLSAEQLLQWPKEPPRQLQDIQELEQYVNNWKARPEARSVDLITSNSKNEVRLRFTEIPAASDIQPDTLIFVEDTLGLNREAQNLKLASLGRLTASIAHEIRNPLSSISHAGQLLAESPQLSSADARLLEIISTNAQRVNQIIENVMQLSRRRPTVPEQIDLKEWVKHFAKEYEEQHKVQLIISSVPDGKPLDTRIDTTHLTQVLTNLTENGLRHSEIATGKKQLLLKVAADEQSQLPYLEVIDQGAGIADEHLSHIFEPFFTTQASGSGLGLYLSRELCEANYARLSYHRTSNNRSCFRIDFAHPDRFF